MTEHARHAHECTTLLFVLVKHLQEYLKVLHNHALSRELLAQQLQCTTVAQLRHLLAQHSCAVHIGVVCAMSGVQLHECFNMCL